MSTIEYPYPQGIHPLTLGSGGMGGVYTTTSSGTWAQFPYTNIDPVNHRFYYPDGTFEVAGDVISIVHHIGDDPEDSRTIRPGDYFLYKDAWWEIAKFAFVGDNLFAVIRCQGTDELETKKLADLVKLDIRCRMSEEERQEASKLADIFAA